MTYQNPTQHYEDNADADADADEASSLFLTVAEASPPSSAFGQAGVAPVIQNNISDAICFVVG